VYLRFLQLSLAATLACGVAASQTKRPRITGVAHIAVFTSDIVKAREFYGGLLGYEEPFLLNNPAGKLDLTFLKINERQYIEIFPKEAGSDRLNHISLETDDIEGMRSYLASRGVAVPPKVNRVRIGNLAFNVKDPDGHTVEFVQYTPDGWTARERGKFIGKNSVSDLMAHVGILVGNLEAAKKFYGDVLGFTETWRGTRDPKQLSWVNMKVPDGDDYIEFMLYKDLPPPDKRGTQHHLCLFVPDIEKSLAALNALPARKGYTQSMEIRTGVNRKRQLNLFDHDGTRVELMEPHTIDGKPAPSSDAPPPR
jgi:catechol 2,3-dioxygenase-like lactoylglutathione lyase family enzyme